MASKTLKVLVQKVNSFCYDLLDANSGALLYKIDTREVEEETLPKRSLDTLSEIQKINKGIYEIHMVDIYRLCSEIFEEGVDNLSSFSHYCIAHKINPDSKSLKQFRNIVKKYDNGR